MGGQTDLVERVRRLTARVLRAPGAGRRRHVEMVRRDDAAHHLLVSLYTGVDELRGRLDELQHRVDLLVDARIGVAAHTTDAVHAAQAAESAVADVASDIASLAIQVADLGAPEPVDGPLVSIVLPTWQRAGIVGDAIRSVLAQTHESWQLLIVDDGSDDGTAVVVEPFLADPRIQLLAGPHLGVSAARNRGLHAAEGELVAYLDSDNTWHPTHLARLVQALSCHPELEWAFSGQAVVDGRDGRAALRKDLRAIDTMRSGNFVDLNTVAHRRSVIDRIGTFDTSLTRLTDWDFVLRLGTLGPPVRTRATTVEYRTDVLRRISDSEPMFVQQHVVVSRHRGRLAEGLRILFAEWHYLQITETYIAALTEAFVALGAHVEVWADTDPSVPAASTLTVHRGSLDEAITAVRPHVVVTHWLNKGTEFRPATRAAGVPHVVRAHGFDHDPGLLDALLDDPGVLVQTFPHLVPAHVSGHPRLAVEVTAFDADRYRPGAAKDRSLVMRTSAGLFTKDLDTFFLAAAQCPDHRFLLVVGHSLLVEERTEALIERAAELGSPCEIRVDVPHAEVAELIGGAGLYLHTHGTDHPVGMPMSIAESMATGCHVLARDLPGMADYLGGAGALYDGATSEARAAEAARLIRATAQWSDDQWARASRLAIEQAFRRHAATDVAERMLRSWQVAFPRLPLVGG